MSAASGLAAEDYIEIQNLYAYYNQCSDAGDAEGFASCFAEDGVFRLDSVGIHLRGRAQVLAYKRGDAARRGTLIRQHWNASIHLKRQPDGSVAGRCYLHGFDGQPGKQPVLADAGAYKDRIVKVDGEWKFAERVVTLDFVSFKAP